MTAHMPNQGSAPSRPPISGLETAAMMNAPERVIFPKEFEIGLLGRIDRRFMLVLFLTIVAVAGVILFLEKNPPDELSMDQVKQLQRQFAGKALDQNDTQIQGNTIAFTEPLDLPIGTPTAGPAGGGMTGGAALPDRVTPQPESESRDLQVATGRGSRASGSRTLDTGTAGQITNEVGKSGLLGLLASNDKSSGGTSASDLLGEGGPDLNRTLGGVKGTQTGSDAKAGGGKQSERRLRGTRDTGGSGIDALVAGLGESKTIGVERTGQLVLNAETPLIETEEGQAVGSRNPDEVAEVVARHNSAIQYCYQRVLKNHPELRGKLAVRFTIDPKGLIAKAKLLSSTLQNPEVEQCVINRIKRWDDFGAIDPSKGNTTVRQIYTFGY